MLSCFGLPRRPRAPETEPLADALPTREPATLGQRTDTSARLAALREELERRKLDAYVVPSEDAHASEWTCSADKRRGM